MILILSGLAASAAFAGAAFYVGWTEQPARLALDDAALLKTWKPSYAKGAEIQSTLALVAGGLGLAAGFLDHSIAAALGGVLMLANWPYTLIVIQPTNKRLGATADEQAGPETRATIVRWGRLHAVRTMLGVAATFAFLLAAAT